MRADPRFALVPGRGERGRWFRGTDAPWDVRLQRPHVVARRQAAARGRNRPFSLCSSWIPLAPPRAKSWISRDRCSSRTATPNSQRGSAARNEWGDQCFQSRVRPLVVALVAAALLTLAVMSTASATTPGRNGLLAFQAQTEEGLQIFTIRSDGHDLQQITHVDGDATASGLGTEWQPDRLRGGRMLDCRRRRGRLGLRADRLGPEPVPGRSGLLGGWRADPVRAIRPGRGCRCHLVHEDRWLGQASAHPRRRGGPERVPGWHAGQLQGRAISAPSTSRTWTAATSTRRHPTGTSPTSTTGRPTDHAS